jgi:hypothetical protein
MDTKNQSLPNELTQLPSRTGEVTEYHTAPHDAVFGPASKGGPNYRNVRAPHPSYEATN